MMMKKIMILMAIMFVLSGCVKGDRYNFSGSSENWDVFYVVDVSGADVQEDKGTIKYTGSGEVPETVNYIIETSAGSSRATGVVLFDDRAANLGYGACGGCAVIQRDEEIEVEISWDGQTENLVLTSGN